MGVNDAIKIDSEAIQGKVDSRMFYIDNYELCTYSLISDISNRKRIEGLDMAPRKFSSIEVNHVIYITGGEKPNQINETLEQSNETYIVDESESTLVEFKPMIFARKGHSLASISRTDSESYINEYIIIASGTQTQSDDSKSIEFLLLSSNEWLRGPNMNVGRYFHSSIIIDNQWLYVF